MTIERNGEESENKTGEERVYDAPFSGSQELLSSKIIGIFYAVHRELGFGFLESVYAKALAIALAERGMRVQAEVPVPVWFHGQPIGTFRADLVVEGVIVLELKVAESISRIHEAQLLHYLRASRFEIGLVLNFGKDPTLRRMEFNNALKGKVSP